MLLEQENEYSMAGKDKKHRISEQVSLVRSVAPGKRVPCWSREANRDVVCCKIDPAMLHAPGVRSID